MGGSYQRRDWLPYMMHMPRYRDGGDLGLTRGTYLGADWNRWDFENTQLFAELSHRLSDDWTVKFNVNQAEETSKLKYAYVRGAVDRATGLGRAHGGGNQYRNRQRPGPDGVGRLRGAGPAPRAGAGRQLVRPQRAIL